jgi:hypothetical protein
VVSCGSRHRLRFPLASTCDANLLRHGEPYRPIPRDLNLTGYDEMK